MKLFSKSIHLFIPLSILLLSCQGNFDKRLQKEAEEYTISNCPQTVEEGTQLDSITYNTNNRVYTLHYSVNANNEQALRQKGNMLHQLLLNNLRNDVNYKEVKDNSVTFCYIYRSKKSGCIVYKTEIKATEYNVKH